MLILSQDLLVHSSINLMDLLLSLIMVQFRLVVVGIVYTSPLDLDLVSALSELELL